MICDRCGRDIHPLSDDWWGKCPGCGDNLCTDCAGHEYRQYIQFEGLSICDECTKNLFSEYVEGIREALDDYFIQNGTAQLITGEEEE